MLTPLRRALLSALALIAAGAAPSLASAQTAAADTPLPLKAGTRLQEKLAPEAAQQAPTFVSGDQITGTTDGPTTVEGNAEMRRHDTVIRADRLEYDRNTGDAKATGNVLVNREGDRFTGPQAQINSDTDQGYFEKPTYHLLRNGVHGDAQRINFLGEKKTQVVEGRYSTCPRVPGADWMPDWLIRASTIDLDTAEDVGTARSGTLEFKGVPLLSVPYLTFPLSDTRKTGVLPPSMALDNQSGFTATVPYYFNLAPNRDLTIEPTLMAKRGVDVGAEFRYLEPTYTGWLKASYMPSDYLRDTHRWAYSVRHNQSFGQITGSDRPLGLGVSLQRVSDGYYWSDFPRSLNALTTRLLRNNAALSWGQGNWNLVAGAFTYQTLQVPDSIITPPYDQLPSLTSSYRNPSLSLLGSEWDLQFTANSTRFQRNHFTPSSSVQGDGNRVYALADLSRRWQTPGWYVQPRARLHMAAYDMDQQLDDGLDTTRVVPTLSVDSGMVFERETAYFGRSYVQTLEPRLFATWTPFREQSQLPNFDSAALSFNMASMFTEHTIGGNDRITDTRAVTLGVNSRLLNPDTGAEVVRLGYAQRAYLADQNVTLPGGAPVTDRMSDMLLAARVQWDPLWSTDFTGQYNPKSGESARSTIGGRYTPGPYQVLSAAYRIQKGKSKQLELGWQWPLSRFFSDTVPQRVAGAALGPNQWYGVGRMNYSTLDRKVVDLVAGFEYDAGCWIGRVVLERLQQNTAAANQRVLFQLEFSGFSRLGGSSLQTLASHIPKYEYLREEVVPPSRFQDYD